MSTPKADVTKSTTCVITVESKVAAVAAANANIISPPSEQYENCKM